MFKEPTPQQASEARDLIEAFAAACGVGLYASARYIGVAEASWKGYATGARVMPLYVERSIKAHLALAQADPRQFRAIVDEARQLQQRP
ncbi:hypothetical protein [Dolichospermum phage Dfl-JY45]